MTPEVPARRCERPWQQSESYGRLGAALGWEGRIQRSRPERWQARGCRSLQAEGRCSGLAASH